MQQAIEMRVIETLIVSSHLLCTQLIYTSVGCQVSSWGPIRSYTSVKLHVDNAL